MRWRTEIGHSTSNTQADGPQPARVCLLLLGSSAMWGRQEWDSRVTEFLSMGVYDSSSLFYQNAMSR